MKLRAKQQIHVSAIKSDTIRPDEVVEVDEERGAELLATLPETFEVADNPAVAAMSEPAPAPAKRVRGRGAEKV